MHKIIPLLIVLGLGLPLPAWADGPINPGGVAGPCGSSGQIQYNNSSACGGSGTTTDSTGDILIGSSAQISGADNVVLWRGFYSSQTGLGTNNGVPAWYSGNNPYGLLSGNGVEVVSGAGYNFHTTTAPTSSIDAEFLRDGTASVAQESGTTAQSFHVYNTLISAGNAEYGVFDWQTTSNVLLIGTEKIGAGSVRNLELIVGGTNELDYGVTTAGTWTFSSPIAAPVVHGTGTIPTATGTGTPTVTTGSSDFSGSVTAGASATSVVITSGQTGYTTPPFCIVGHVGTITAFTAPITVSAGHYVITVTQTSTSADLITWICPKNS